MHRLTATDTPMVRYTRTIFPSYAISIKFNQKKPIFPLKSKSGRKNLTYFPNDY